MDFDDATWRTIELPHDWSIEGAADKKLDEADAFLP
jgi:beta-galactosidase